MNRLISMLRSFKKTDSSLPVINLAKIKWYFENSDTSLAYQVLTEQTSTDLNFDEFFLYINRTSSCVGQQYLYDRIRRIPHESEIVGFENTILFLKNNQEWAVRCRNLLSKLAHDDAYYICSLFQDTHPVLSPVMKQVFRILQFMPLLFALIFMVSPKTIWLLLTGGFFITNLIFHYRNKKIQFSYLYSIPQFLKLVSIIGKVSSENPFNKTHSDIKSHLLSVQSLVRKLSFFKFELKIENDLAALAYIIKELVSVFFLYEPNILFRSFQMLNEKRTEIESIFACAGHIDLLLSIAHLQEELPYFCKPQWTDEGFRMVDAYHPLIEHCIPNTLDTGGKSILLTGSNMSGKTTFIRTVAINMLSAQTIGLCFARSFCVRRMKIHSAINLNDNLSESQSFYMKEVLIVKEMLEESHRCADNLFVLDEIYKGTNTPERIAASKAVLSALARNGNMVFVSTHDIELADLLSEEYELYHFCEQIEQNRLSFDYLLKHGRLTHRNAIKLLEIANYPKNVITEATAIVGKFL